MDHIMVQWDGGYIHVVMDTFFPASMSQVKKLFKLIQDDDKWDKFASCEMLLYFQEQIDVRYKRIEEYERKAVTYAEEANLLKSETLSRRDPAYQKYMRVRDKSVLFTDKARQAKADISSYQRTISLMGEMLEVFPNDK